MVRSRPAGGGDNWSYKTCKSPVLLLNQQCQSTEGKCIAVLHLLNGQFPQQPGKADTQTVSNHLLQQEMMEMAMLTTETLIYVQIICA